MYKCVIIDDDLLSINILEKIISNRNDITVFGSYTNPAKAINEISVSDEIDFLFLDIKMEISGIEVAKVLRDKVKYLIFVTAYDGYAIDAFKAHVDKYLLKPITNEKIQLALDQIEAKEKRRSG